MMTEWLFSFGPQDYTYPGEVMTEYQCTQQRRTGRGALYSAAEHGKTKHVSMLLMLGKDPDRTDSFGITPLQIAAWNNHCKVVQKLCKRSSDVNIADKVGHTALFKSVWKNCVTCVQCLLQAGAFLDRKDYSGSTPLLLACELGFTPIVRLLLQTGARTHSQNKRGEAALHIATSQGHVTCVMMLLEYGADPDQRNRSGCTSLMLAAGMRSSFVTSFNIMKLLIKVNCSLEIRSKTSGTKGYNLSPMECAFCARNIPVVSLLYRCGANFTRIQRWHAMQMDILIGYEAALETLHDLVNSPRTLRDICRFNIRRAIRGKCKPCDLPLPAILKDYLDLQDILGNDIEIFKD